MDSEEQMNTDSTDGTVERGDAPPDEAISPELREYWSRQAELDVRDAGLSHPGAVDVGIGLWNKGLVAGIRWCRTQLADTESAPRVCSGCQILWPVEAFDGDAEA